jgi:glycosyltransferase involved in cell wall biosynthesis
MKIGIDIRLIGKKQTGSEVVFFNLVKNFARIGGRNEYFLYTDILDEETLREIKLALEIEGVPGFKVVPLRTKNKFSWNFWTIAAYLRQNPVDVYLTQYITPFFIPKKIKVATIVHDVSFNVYGKFIKLTDLFFLKLLMPLSLKRADRIIGVSRFTQEEILKYYKLAPEKVTWIHNAVGDNFQTEISQEQIAAVKTKYKLPEKFILYVGTLQPRKNLPTLVAAYAGLPAETRREVKLALAGGKGHNYDRRIDEMVTKYSLMDDVIFTGFVSEADKPVLFKASHIFCNPSLYEGFGITILEAMALGVPVVASDILPHREVAEDSIIYCNPADPGDLTEKLNSVLINAYLRQDLAEKEPIQARKFSWRTTAAKVLKIFADLDNHPRPKDIRAD